MLQRNWLLDTLDRLAHKPSSGAHWASQPWTIFACTATCNTLFTVLYLTRALQPKRLSKSERLEWAMRMVSSLHALVLTVGSAVCFWDARTYDRVGCIFGYTVPPDIFARIFLGYLLHDLAIMLLFYRHLRDPSGIAHHIVFVAVTAYVLAHSIYKFAFGWLALTELSTPFINLRWHLAVSGLKDSAVYTSNGLLIVIIFGAVRIVGYALGLAHLWRLRDVWWEQHSVPAGHKAIAGMFLLGFVLNVYWYGMVLSAVHRAVVRRKQA